MKDIRRKREPRGFYEGKKFWIGRPFTGKDPQNIRTFGEVLRFFADNPRPASLQELEHAARFHVTDNKTQDDPWQFIAYLYDCWWLIDPQDEQDL